jgi:hypothetical protein
MSAPRKNRLPIAIAVAIPIVCCGGPLLYLARPTFPVAFDERQWKADTSLDRSPPDIRYRMRTSLIDDLNRRKEKATKNEVESILGRAEYVFPGDRIYNEEADDELLPGETFISYTLMNAPPFPQSYTATLWIKFDPKGELDHAFENDGLFP